MAGGDWVQVGLPRADVAATALEELRGTLDGQMQAILSAISKLRVAGADIPAPTALVQMASRAPGDAAQMRAAADLAAKMNAMPMANASNLLMHMVTLNVAWNTPGLTQAAAQADAAALEAAVSQPIGPVAERLITNVQLDLADHQGDATYLKAFWSTPGIGAAVTGLAWALHRENPPAAATLTTADKRILSTFGNSLAAAVSQPGLLDAKTSQALVTAFARPSGLAGLWSAGMLIKYGPPGAAYGTSGTGTEPPTGPKLLAGLTETLLSASMFNGYPTITGFDPLNALLQRSTQNKTAASLVMAGYDPVTGQTSKQLGVMFANSLMEQQTPHPATLLKLLSGPERQFIQGLVKTSTPPPQPQGPQSRFQEMYVPNLQQDGFTIAQLQAIPPATAGAFLYGAVADRTSRYSALSLLSIMGANLTAEVFPQPIRNSLLKIASYRLPDLAWTAGLTSNDWKTGVTMWGGFPIAVSNLTQLRNLLTQAFHDPVAAYKYIGSTEAKLSLATQMQIATNEPWITNVSALVAASLQALGQDRLVGAERKAAQKAMVQQFASFILSPAIMWPTPTAKTLSLAASLTPDVIRPMLGKLALTEGSQVFGDYGMHGGDPASILFGTDQQFVSRKTASEVPVIQGLVRSGVLKPDPKWYQNGHVVPGPDLTNMIMKNWTTWTYKGHTLEWFIREQTLQGFSLQQ